MNVITFRFSYYTCVWLVLLCLTLYLLCLTDYIHILDQIHFIASLTGFHEWKDNGMIFCSELKPVCLHWFRIPSYVFKCLMYIWLACVTSLLSIVFSDILGVARAYKHVGIPTKPLPASRCLNMHLLFCNFEWWYAYCVSFNADIYC